MPMPFDMLDEIQEQALDRCMWISTELIKATMGDTGRVYGDVLPERADRIARFMDLAERGILDRLEVIAKPTYEQLLADYERDVRNSPIVRP